jgi:HEAT repeat protein
MPRAGHTRRTIALVLVLVALAYCAWRQYENPREAEWAAAFEDIPATDDTPANRAIVRLADRGTAAIPELLRALADKDPRVRRDAIFGLIRLGKAEESVVMALRARLGDESPHVRGQAAMALGRIDRGSRASAVAITRLFDDPVLNVKNCASIALVQLGPAAIPVVTALVEGPRPGIRLQALIVLRHFHHYSDEVVAVLRRAAGEADPQIREAAILAILTDWHATLEEVTAWMMDRNPRIAGGAVASLPKFGPKGVIAIPNLMKLLESSLLPNELSQVLAALRSLKGAARPAVPAIQRLLDSPVNYDPVEILETLSQTGMEESALTALLLRYLQDETPHIAGRSAELLAQFNPKVADEQAALIAKNLNRNNPETLHSALAALHGLGRPAVIALPQLIELLEGDNSTYYEQAAIVLANLGPEAAPAAPAIAARLNPATEHLSIQLALIDAAGSIGPAAAPAVDRLIEIIRRAPAERNRMGRTVPNNRARNAALMAVARIGVCPDDYLELLREALVSDSTSMRTAALRSIAILGHDAKVSVDEISPMLDSPDAVERLMAAGAIIALDGGTPRVAQQLVGLLKDGDLEIRAVAAATLGDLGPSARDALPDLKAALKSADNFPSNSARQKQRSRTRDYLDDEPRVSVVEAVENALARIDPGGTFSSRSR